MFCDRLNGVNDYYIKNAQGDVVRICDESGNIVITYNYDAWGNLVNFSGSVVLLLANPFRYRGYYYDLETGFYYLNSRYYDPVTCRMLNADGLIDNRPGGSTNMFQYCGNNPVNNVDHGGGLFGAILLGAAFLGTLFLGGCAAQNKPAPNPEPYSNQANCYAYAMKLENDPRTNQPFTQKPQPGEFSGNSLTAKDLRGGSSTVKKNINTKVTADAKVLKLNYTEVKSFDHVPKSGNWVVALAYATDGRDYHWWRRNDDGTWSHKPGSTPIIHWDSSGNTITDPGNCNRGIYDGFLGYYEVGPN